MRLRLCCAAACLTAALSGGCAEEADSDRLAAARAYAETYQVSAVSFRAMDAFFPHEVVQASLAPRTLPVEPLPLHDVFELDGLSLETVLAETDTNALLILSRGRIVYERYFNGADARSRFVGWSMSKSLVSVLFGIAFADGVIEALNDPVEKYLPDLAGSAYGQVTLENMLRMRAGVDYSEGPRYGLFGPSDLDRQVAASLFRNQRRFTDIEQLALKSDSPQGETFNYSTLTSTVLGRVVESATGQSLAEYTQTRLWVPGGMSESAYWLLDGPSGEGHAFGGGGFNATARDFARWGQLMLDGGSRDGVPIIPIDWIQRSTLHQGSNPVIPGTPRGYGYQWWTVMGTSVFEAVGIHGQFLSIDPASETVIVKLSYWPERGGGTQARRHLVLFDRLRTSIATLERPAR